MFIYNLKLSKSMLSKLFICISLIIILLIVSFSIYIIFFKNRYEYSNCNNGNQTIELNETNYVNVLKAANEDINSYIGMKFKVTGYVYRLLDFKKDEFVIARDMCIGPNSQYVVVGFLCHYNLASDFEDGTWVQVTGKIKKGKFNNSDIAILEITSMNKLS